MFRRLKNEKGISLLLFLVLLLMLTLVGVLAMNNSLTNIDVSGNRNKGGSLVYKAEAGVEKAVAKIRDYYDHNDTVMSSPSFPCDSFMLAEDSVRYNTFCDSASAGLCNAFQPNGIVTASYVFSGLAGVRSISYRVISEAWKPGIPNRAKIIQQVVVYHIPVFKFSAIYDFDLEVSPEWTTPHVDSLRGRIHTNADLYLEAPSGSGHSILRLGGPVSARGSIFHGHNLTFTGTWPNGWGSSNCDSSIQIRDFRGFSQNMRLATNCWLDHSHPKWIDSSLAKWGGKVEDRAHGISGLYLKMVLPEGDSTRGLILRESENSVSLERKAGLKIYSYWRNSAWRDTALCHNTGTWVSCTDSLFGQHGQLVAGDTVVEKKRSYDQREGDTVRCYVLDIQRLNQSGYYPTNGIIYIDRDTTLSGGNMLGVMITNATFLPCSTTIVSKVPVYIVGDFNTVNVVKPAAIIADAVTIFSGDQSFFHLWEPIDGGPSCNISGKEVVRSHTVNACIMAGNRPTTSSNYSGGLWNLVRLLEDWSQAFWSHWNPCALTINGSTACFWRSQYATAPYRFPYTTGYGNAYYSEPRPLIFRYDDAIASAPGQPVLNLVIKTKRSVGEGI